MTSALQGIVFDFDGVIADSEPLHLRAFQRTLLEHGLQLSPAEYYARYLGYDDVGLIRALAEDRGVTLSESDVQAFLARKAAALKHMLQDAPVLFPGAAEFIRAAAAEVPVAIASGALRHEIVAILDGASLRDVFTAIVASGDTPDSKPSPAPYVLAFERLRDLTGLDLQPGRCVAIEDSRWGLQSARGAGLRCVGVTTSYPAEELEGADLVVVGLGELDVPTLDQLCAEHLVMGREAENAP
jgi:beta-phosphoglucomutase